MDVTAALTSLGWRVNTTARRTQAVKDYQRAYNLGPALTVDGSPGPATVAALANSLKRKAAGLGDISANFSAIEFACQCDGAWSDCRRIWPERGLIRLCEAFRTLAGVYTPARGCRCPRENARVGGVSNSQHLYGRAVDVPVFDISPAKVKTLGVARGIGWYSWAGRQVVRHLDVRLTSSTTSPATWDYGDAKSAPLTPRPVTTTTPAPAPISLEDDDMKLTDMIPVFDPTTGKETTLAYKWLIRRNDWVYHETLRQRAVLDAIAAKLLTAEEIEAAAKAGAEAALNERIAAADVTLEVTP